MLTSTMKSVGEVDGDRADVQGGAGQGVARHREAGAGPFVGRRRLARRGRRHARRDAAARGRRRGSRPARRSRRSPPSRRSTRGSSTRSPRCVERNGALRDQPLHTLGAAELLAAEACRRLRRAHRCAHGRDRSRRCADTATRSACSRCSRRSTPAPGSSRRARRTTTPRTRRRPRSRPAARPRVVILGAGPNRIGQGIEFDYACVHAAFALEEAGLRVGDGELEPRDGVDRLRHVEPPVLRAARRPRTCSRCATPSGPSA